jgi:hypothetical protein
VEWYLTRVTSAADGFMMEQLLDHDGWMPIATLLAFPRMQKLCHPQESDRPYNFAYQPGELT